jgi:iron complex transport system substrate-binding protein
MKTKTLAVVEIAIVLCSVFLVATLPAIAADQTDEPLGIYGNANMDDIIDMRDTTYTKLIIFRKKPDTKFADANHDGKVSMLDVGQVKLIIFGKQKELTVEDDFGAAITFRFPIERFIYHGHNAYVYETLRALGVEDRLIGITDRFLTPGNCRYSENYFPELVGFTNVGILKSPDYEVINELEPDAVITDEERYLDRGKMPGIPVIAMDVKLKQFTGNTRKYGYIFDKREEAEEYINWHNGWENLLRERIEGLSEDEKPLVYFASSYTPGKKSYPIYGKDHYRSELVRMAGGNNLGDEISGSASVNVDPEWIIVRNPEIILFGTPVQISGYDYDDSSEVAALRDDFLSLTEWEKVKAVEEEKVYMLNFAHFIVGGSSGLLACVYWAKWIHPELFKDLDAKEVHQEFVTRFQHLDFDVREQGVFEYPPQ